MWSNKIPFKKRSTDLLGIHHSQPGGCRGLDLLATAAHQGWSANIYPIGSDLFPKHLVASVSGLGGTAGSIGGMIRFNDIALSRGALAPGCLFAL